MQYIYLFMQSVPVERERNCLGEHCIRAEDSMLTCCLDHNSRTEHKLEAKEVLHKSGRIKRGFALGVWVLKLMVC